MTKQFTITVDIMDRLVNYNEVTPVYNQGDTNTDILSINITKKEIPYDLTGSTVSVYFNKPDGTVVIQDSTNGLSVTNAANGQISITLNTQTLTVPGRVYGALKIQNGTNIVESNQFFMYVTKSLTTSQALESENILDPILGASTLTTKAQDIKGAINEVNSSLAEIALQVNSSTTTDAVNAFLATPSNGVKRLIGVLTLTKPLIIPSNTVLDCSGATINSNFAGNMLQNANAFSTTNRDSNITIIGGTWNRGNNGGTGNGLHSLFLRHVDGLNIHDLTYLSTNGKYGIAVGDVTNYTIKDITGNCSSDTIHVTGPATNGFIDRVNSIGGDDIVGVTTTDYGSYDDVHGNIDNLTIRNVTGTNSTRIVLLCSSANGVADGFNLTNIIVDKIVQKGTGSAVITSAPWTGSQYIDNLRISNIFGGQIRLQHVNHKRVILENIVMNISGEAMVAIQPEATSSNIVQITSLILRDSEFTGTGAGAHAVYMTGQSSIDKLTIDGLIAHMSDQESRVVRLEDQATISIVRFTNCTIDGLSTNYGDLVHKYSSTSSVTTVSVLNCSLTGIRGILQNGGNSGTTLRLTNVTLTNCNRVAQGGNPLTVTFSSLSMSGMLNQPFYISTGGTLDIRGSGWYGYTNSAIVRASTEVLRSVSQEVPVDVSILAKNNGDIAYNTNSGLSCGVGVAVCNGTNWKNLYSGATY